MRVANVTFRRWMLLGAALAVIVVAAVAYRSRTSRSTPPQPSAPALASADGAIRLDPSQRSALGIETDAAMAATAVPLAGLSAEALPGLAAGSQVTVPVAGVVTRVLTDEGQRVERGAPLLRMRSRELVSMGSELAQARAEASAARQQAARDIVLADEGVIPIARRTESTARAATAQARLDGATAMFAQLQRVPNGQPGEYAILAPQAGTLLHRYVAPGMALEPMAPAFTIADTSEVDIQFHVPVSLRPVVRPGLAVALPDGAQARVIAIGASVDPVSQALRVRARAQQDTGLVPGRQLEVVLLLPAPADALSVPASALVSNGAHEIVYVETSDAFRGFNVERLGGTTDTAVVRGKGLVAGMQVVTKGAGLLKAMAPPAE